MDRGNRSAVGEWIEERDREQGECSTEMGYRREAERN